MLSKTRLRHSLKLSKKMLRTSLLKQNTTTKKHRHNLIRFKKNGGFYNRASVYFLNSENFGKNTFREFNT